MREFNGMPIDNLKRDDLIRNIVLKFTDEDYPKRILISNHLKNKPTYIVIEELKKLELPNSDMLYFYGETRKILYKTNFEDICKYIHEQLELLHGVSDYLVFDDSTDWVLAITHNDSFMLDWIK